MFFNMPLGCEIRERESLHLGAIVNANPSHFSRMIALHDISLLAGRF
jgi:hypothetical protein